MEKHSYSTSQIVNMDESAIYLDSPSNYSYARLGSKRVKASTAGAERVRLSSAWAGTASEFKLPIYLIIPRKNAIPDLNDLPNIIIKYRSSSTFDADIIIEWLTKVIIPYKQQREFDRILLVIDLATCHVSQQVILIVKFF